MYETAQLREWSSQFGNAYTDRNQVDFLTRLPAWQVMLSDLSLGKVLEVGCNRAHNLSAIASIYPDCACYGIDPNRHALANASNDEFRLNLVSGTAFDLPFRSDYFDLVFTAGVLIHIAPSDLDKAMAEIVRVSKRYILAAEYFAENETPIEYRGRTDLLWKRNFLAMYRNQYPELQVIRTGYWDVEHGFDRTHWWLLEKPQS